jgi:transcriptional regulator with XRE-family HTH domain
VDATTPEPFGKRLQRLRTRRGMTREVLGGLVGRRGQWVKDVETGRLQMPKLHMLIQLSEVLRVDLAELAGSPESVLRGLSSPGHPALPAVRDAINEVPWDADDVPPEPVAVLQARLDAAWRARHAAPDHRTVLGTLLPGLIRDCRRAVRAYTTGDDARRARAIMAGVWNLTQFFVAYQPDAGLLWRVAERGMTVAMESDDPHAIGGAVWLLAQAHRDQGEFEAAESVNLRALEYLEPRVADTGEQTAAMYGALLFEAGYTAARSGQRGTAWHYWDRADRIAGRLAPGFYDPMTSFSKVVMGAHAVTVAVEAQQKAEGLKQARRNVSLAIPSNPRRGRHLIEVARAFDRADEPEEALGTLQDAYRTAPETIRYNGYARRIVSEMTASGPAGLRREAAGLAERIGIVA